jgi:hypothetical protein
VAFIRDAGPGWPRYDQTTRTTRVFGGSSEIVEDPDPDATRRQLWQGVR